VEEADVVHAEEIVEVMLMASRSSPRPAPARQAASVRRVSLSPARSAPLGRHHHAAAATAFPRSAVTKSGQRPHGHGLRRHDLNLIWPRWVWRCGRGERGEREMHRRQRYPVAAGRRLVGND